jgi:hypothetical protein
VSENETEIVLNETGKMVMEAIQTATETHRLYGRDRAACDHTVAELCRRLLDDAPMPVHERNRYRWFLGEAARLLRTRTGADLADGYVMLLAKWKGLGLKQGRMELFLGALWDAVRPLAAGEER